MRRVHRAGVAVATVHRAGAAVAAVHHAGAAVAAVHRAGPAVGAVAGGLCARVDAGRVGDVRTVGSEGHQGHRQLGIGA